MEGYVGDETMYRSFIPESLNTSKMVKRKATNTSWCFNFDNIYTHREPAHGLYVEFRKAVMEMSSHAPFDSAVNLDGRGKKWMFTAGAVPTGESAFLCGTVKGTRGEEVKNWWWLTDLVVWNDDVEEMVEGILGEENGKLAPSSQSPGAAMPNTANLGNEIFEQVPFDRGRPLVIGVESPTARSDRVAYVALNKYRNVYNSLEPARDGTTHRGGPPGCFDFYDNGREMKGKLSTLKPGKQRNRLFAELVALKLNIYGSAMRKTPVGFGELRYVDPVSRFNGMLVREIDSAANVYMTYCDSSDVGSGVELDSVVRRINSAFVGPLDTVSFVSKLVFTGVRPIEEVSILLRDTSIIPMRIEPAAPLAETPEEFELYQNYPNPFNPSTTIEFNLPWESTVTLRIYNILGEEVATLIDHQEMDEGIEEVELYAENLSSGVYFYRVIAEEIRDEEEGATGRIHTSVKKMILIR